jgi:hypothetical protein
MGVPSPGVWQKYLSAFFPQEKIESVNFKEKSIGWNRFCFYAKTDKREYRDIGMENLYLRSMFLTWNIRPSCFVCPFKKLNRLSDITLADCWGANKLVPEINDNKGLSSVLVHSEKGARLLNAIKSKLLIREIPLDEIVKGNINMIENKPERDGRDLFYEMLKNDPKKAFETLWNALVLDKDEAVKELEKCGLSKTESAELEQMLHPQEKKEIYLVMSRTMLYQIGWYEHFANWDFTGEQGNPQATTYRYTPDGYSINDSEEGKKYQKEVRSKETIWRLLVEGEQPDGYVCTFGKDDGVEQVIVWKIY